MEILIVLKRIFQYSLLCVLSYLLKINVSYHSSLLNAQGSIIIILLTFCARIILLLFMWYLIKEAIGEISIEPREKKQNK